MTTNAVYQKLGTQITFKESGGDVLWTPKNVANGAGRLSTRADLGAFPRATRYRWYAENQCQATPTAGALIRYYLAPWDDDSTPADPWGDVGASDAAFATEGDLRNLLFLGAVIADVATADVVFSGGGFVDLPYRYVSLVVWNASGAALTNDAAEHYFRLTPIYDDIQAAA